MGPVIQFLERLTHPLSSSLGDVRPVIHNTPHRLVGNAHHIGDVP